MLISLRLVSVVQKHAQIRAICTSNWRPTYLAVNSSKLSSWWPASCPSLSADKLRLVVLKQLAEVALIVGAARGVKLRSPLDLKIADGCARVAIRRILVDDIRKSCCGEVIRYFVDFRRVWSQNCTVSTISRPSQSMCCDWLWILLSHMLSTRGLE